MWNMDVSKYNFLKDAICSVDRHGIDSRYFENLAKMVGCQEEWDSCNADDGDVYYTMCLVMARACEEMGRCWRDELYGCI